MAAAPPAGTDPLIPIALNDIARRVLRWFRSRARRSETSLRFIPPIMHHKMTIVVIIMGKFFK